MNKRNRRRKGLYSLRTRMIQINVAIILASFIACSGIFLYTLWNMFGTYKNQEQSFLLEQTNEELVRKMEYLEEMILGVRDSDLLLSFLNMDKEREDPDVREEFSRVVWISKKSNQYGHEGVFAESVYMIREDNALLSEYYYRLNNQEIKQNERIILNVYQTYEQKLKQEGLITAYFETDDTYLYLVYPVQDRYMVERGVMLFQIRLNTVVEMMKPLESYENSFWYFGGSGKIILGEKDRFVYTEFEKHLDKSPDVYTFDGKQYRMHGKNLGMDLYIVSGIQMTEVFSLFYRYIYLYAIITTLIMVVGIVSFVCFTFHMTKPMGVVADRIHEVSKGNYNSKLPDYSNREFHEISKGFNEMTEHINYLINEVYKKQIAVKEIELKFIQSQLNPHFMFNTLNVMALRARMDGNQELGEMLSSFSQLMQAKIYRKDKDKVQIGQELEYVEYYLKLQQFRYGDKLTWEIKKEKEELLDYYIPKLCLQLIVENAVVHGIEPKRRKGHVLVELTEKERGIQIRVVDNGSGFSDYDGEVPLPMEQTEESREHNQIGLNSVYSILRLMYGEDYGIHIFTKRGMGTEVKICIPRDTTQG